MPEFKPYYQRINTMPEHSEEYKKLMEMRDKYEQAIEKFNQMNREAKNYKKNVLLPLGRELKKLEDKMFKPKTIGT